MNKEITYSGFAANLPGYNCPDGEFDAVMDLWHENGAYRPVLAASDVLTLSQGYEVIYLHTPKTGTRNYIIRYEGTEGGNTIYKIFWCQTFASRMELASSTTNIFQSATAIGNTLILLTENGMKYYLWKGSSYQYLGDHLPELDISFGLQGETHVDEQAFTVALTDAYSSLDDLISLTDDNITDVTNAVMAKVNKFIADHSKKNGKGRFIYPFLVRYTYRLYDGSFAMQSAPIFMACATSTAPGVTAGPTGPSTSGNEIQCHIYGLSYDLDYAALSQSQLNALANWKDIIRSVDIFVSAPLWTYDQSGQIKSIQNISDPTYMICKWQNPSVSLTAMTRYQKYNQREICRWAVNPSADMRKVILPGRDEDWLEEQIKTCGNYYLLKSYDIDEISTTRTIIDFDEEYLQSLLNRETLTDDWDSHDSLIPKYSFVYNQRINLANVGKGIFNGFHPQSMICFSDGYKYCTSANNVWHVNSTEDSVDGLKIYNYVQDGSREIIVTNNSEIIANKPGEGQFGHYALQLLLHLYYPNTKAKKALLKYIQYNSSSIASNPITKQITLDEHPTLNGSVFTKKTFDFGSIEGALPVVSVNKIIDLPNKLYTSEINNPFFFPVTNINTIGVGEILGICSATKPMSLGQFGQFPLYVFATDGIWAMEVSSTGGYSAKQPISMELCNRDTISQLDSAVAFSTDRGIMLISGSNVDCITETIDNGSDSIFVINNTNLPQSETVLSQDATRLASMVSFRTFITGAKTIYDSVSQRLIVFNPSYTYAYVFAMDGSKQWGMMRSNIKSAINAYPLAYAMTTDNKLVNLSARQTNSSPSQLLVTRPLKLDMPDVMKRITSIIQRGNFSKRNGTDAVQCVLYGSRNLVNWFAVWSSTDRYLRGMHGTAYKYYRILLKCSLLDSESISGCSVEFEPDLTDQPR